MACGAVRACRAAGVSLTPVAAHGIPKHPLTRRNFSAFDAARSGVRAGETCARPSVGVGQWIGFSTRPHSWGRGQVSNLGAEPFRGASRGGQGSCTQIAGGNQCLRSARSTGMTRGRGEASLPAGGPARHVPVLLAESMEALAARAGSLYLDGTFGAGGYSRALLALGAEVIGVDRDPRAIAEGRAMATAASGRLQLVEGRFGDLDEIARRLGWERLDGVALDIGVSSMQLDEAERGFSLRFDAFLDMRMEGEGRTAADILAEDDEQTLADIFYHFGEERAARRIARAIVTDRPSVPYVSTLQLARMIARVAPARPGELTHPATKVFQALRIAVNDELGQLLLGLAAAERALAPGGRLVVVTFHSLEDRIVKQFLARRSGRGRAASRQLPGEAPIAPPSFLVRAGQPILPSAAELAVNPRARSAKLRWAERTDAPPVVIDAASIASTRLPLNFARKS